MKLSDLIDELCDDIQDIIGEEVWVEGEPGWEDFHLTKEGEKKLRALIEAFASKVRDSE